MSSTFLNLKISIRLILPVAVLAAAISTPIEVNARSSRCNALFEARSSSDAAAQKSIPGFKSSSTEIDRRTVYFEHFPAKKGKQTVVMFIGIYTPIVDFVEFKHAFAANSKGEGILIVSYDSMPDSLEAAARNGTGKRDVQTRTSLDEMVRDGTAAVNAAGIGGRAVALGYSYGSAVAARFATFHRERVTDVIFLAPLVFNGEHSQATIGGVSAINSLTFWNPLFGPAMIENARERTARTTAEEFVASYYDSQPKPTGVDRADVLVGTAGRIRATETFDLRNEDFQLLPQAHFVFGEKENPLRLQAQTEAVQQALTAANGNIDKIPTVTSIVGADHILLGTGPVATANAVLDVLRRREARDASASTKRR